MRFVFSQTFDVFFKVRPKTNRIPKGRYRRRVNPTFTMSFRSQRASRKRGAQPANLIIPRSRYHVPRWRDGGARRIRTDDILLAKQALYQLSYGPLHTV